MNFADLTWERDIKDVDGNDLGWRAEYEAPNGYLLCVECVVDFQAENGEPALASATAPDQKYNVSIWSWDRAEGSADPYSEESNITNNRVDSIIDEMEALEGEVFPETTTTTTQAPDSGQWD